LDQQKNRTTTTPTTHRRKDSRTPLRKPLSECKVVLLTTGGVHMRGDKAFNLNSDSTFRVIPRNAQPDDLAISHQAYDRTDALKDINLVFPIERLRELEAKHVIGRLADEHYGFGLRQRQKANSVNKGGRAAYQPGRYRPRVAGACLTDLHAVRRTACQRNRSRRGNHIRLRVGERSSHCCSRASVCVCALAFRACPG
jgi:Glycine/sarcosine/betaine reductase selenoprotein B (GRDB)